MGQINISKTDFTTSITNPEEGAFALGFDLDGELKKKDSDGNISTIGGGGGGGDDLPLTGGTMTVDSFIKNADETVGIKFSNGFVLLTGDLTESLIAGGYAYVQQAAGVIGFGTGATASSIACTSERVATYLNGVEVLLFNASITTIGTSDKPLYLYGSNIIPEIPFYADDATADADTELLSGAFYKITGSRIVYQKP